MEEPETDHPSWPEPEKGHRKAAGPSLTFAGWGESLAAGRRMAAIGTEITASIVGMGLFGWLLDRWWGTEPWLMVTGLILGVIGGLYNAVRKGMSLSGGNRNRSKP